MAIDADFEVVVDDGDGEAVERGCVGNRFFDLLDELVFGGAEADVAVLTDEDGVALAAAFPDGAVAEVEAGGVFGFGGFVDADVGFDREVAVVEGEVGAVALLGFEGGQGVAVDAFVDGPVACDRSPRGGERLNRERIMGVGLRGARGGEATLLG